MNLPTRSFTDIVRDMSASITSSAGRLVDLSVGSVLRAILEANAAVVLWVQWLVLLTLQTTRAATSAGSDLDSWMADFSLSRLPATTALGIITVSRFSGTTAAFVPAGTAVKTQDGTVSFTVTIDTANPAWQTNQNAYCLATGVMSLDLPIIASFAGQSGNVLSNTITLLSSSVPGVDLVTNGIATSGGENPEADEAFRSRFTNFFAARSRATFDAIAYSISLVGPDFNFSIQENVDATGNTRFGNILIIVDDGSGSLTDSRLNALAAAIAPVRPIGTTFSIRPPQVIQVQVSLAIKYPQELSRFAAQGRLQIAIRQYIDKLPIGGTLSITRISQLAYQTQPEIINISNVALNGNSIDMTAPPATSFKTEHVDFI